LFAPIATIFSTMLRSFWPESQPPACPLQPRDSHRQRQRERAQKRTPPSMPVSHGFPLRETTGQNSPPQRPGGSTFKFKLPTTAIYSPLCSDTLKRRSKLTAHLLRPLLLHGSHASGGQWSVVLGWLAGLSPLGEAYHYRAPGGGGLSFAPWWLIWKWVQPPGCPFILGRERGAQTRRKRHTQLGGRRVQLSDGCWCFWWPFCPLLTTLCHSWTCAQTSCPLAICSA